MAAARAGRTIPRPPSRDGRTALFQVKNTPPFYGLLDHVRVLRRPVLAFLVALSMLFGQLAVAAYACPGATSMAGFASSMPDMPDCGGTPESKRDPLCLAHCQQGDQSRDTPSVSLPPAAPACGPTLHVAPRDHFDERVRLLGFLLERSIEPPVSLRHCRLHI